MTSSPSPRETAILDTSKNGRTVKITDAEEPIAIDDTAGSIQKPNLPLYHPPLRFNCIGTDIYRGSYPLAVNMRFLRQLDLKTIISITPEPVDPVLPGVEYLHFECATGDKQKSKKKRGVPISRDYVEQVLDVMADPKRQPVYIHCLNGAQVTSLVVGCYRRRNNWSTISVLAEFERYSDYDRAEVVFLEQF